MSAAGAEEARLRDLLARVGQGDRAAFAAFYRATEARVFGFAQRRLNDPFEAADVLHNVFMDVWRTAAAYEGKSAVSTWLLGIAHHKTIDRLRKRPGETQLDEEAHAQCADEAPDAEALLARAADAQAVRDCLQKLPPDQRTAVQMVFFEELTYAEIAKVVGRPEGTIKTRVFHAKQALKRCLAASLEDAA
jgi:RNA polymerase sigma-70 factor (ECF subfamily)